MLISLLNNFCTARVKLAGSPYLSFGIFGVLNYPLSYLYHIYHDNDQGYESASLRLIATLLCLILSFYQSWPIKAQKYLPLYWHFTLLFCLPFVGTYLLLYNNFSITWLMNIVLALFLLILIVDWLSFILLISLGTILGTLAFISTGGNLYLAVKQEYLSMALYMYLFAIIIGGVFSRNKEILEIERNNTTDSIRKLNNSLEHKVHERTMDLQKALAAKTEFLNNMSHEIRTPIHGFSAISEGLAEHWHDLNEAKKYSYVKEIATNAKRLKHLLNNLLDMSKFTSNKMLIDCAEIDLGPLVESIISECKSMYLTKKHINISYTSNSKSLVMADRERMLQVLRNLFVNAIKFTPESGGIVAAIEVTEESVYFSLSDSGVGIPEDELDEIFEVFVQSSRTKTKAGGTGLGLSIVKNIINSHQGKIWATNNDEQGATFHFILPRKK